MKILLFILAFIAIFFVRTVKSCPCDWPEGALPVKYDPEKIRNCDEIIWLTPTYQGDYNYVKLRVKNKEDVDSLKRIFSRMTPIAKLDVSLMDYHGDIYCGYFIFKKGQEAVASFEVQPGGPNKKAVRWCRLLIDKEDKKIIVMLHCGGFCGRALVANEDYRNIIKRIERPENFKNIKIYDVFHEYLDLK